MELDEPDIRFKAKKRTGTLRQRDASPEAPPAPTTLHAPPSATPPPPDDSNRDEAADGREDASAVQAALKLRKNRRLRGGVAFGRDEPPASASDETSLVPRDAVAVAHGLPDRFTHQTGFVADADDKHMMAYVESRLSSRAAGADATTAHTDPATSSNSASMKLLDGRRRQHAPGTVQVGTSTTNWPKLVEVPVPVDPRGTKRKPSADPRNPTAHPPQPPRRRRNRRGSDDMKRDAMVEAFLHENKLDVYDVPTTTTPAAAAAVGGGDVDAALAADFRRQYMDEVAARRQRRRPALNQPRMTHRQQVHQQAVLAGEVLRGPKLGGSRNARAAVRDALLQQQEQKKREGSLKERKRR